MRIFFYHQQNFTLFIFFIFLFSINIIFTHEEHIITSYDNTPIYTCFIPAQQEIKCSPTILWVHGFGIHSDYNLEAINHLAAHGYNSINFDTRKHGKTNILSIDNQKNTQKNIFSRMPAHSTWISLSSRDIQTIYSYYKPRITGKFFIVAHSMGGLITCSHLQEPSPIPVDAVILSAPCLGIHTDYIPRWKQFLLRILGTLFPHWSFAVKGTYHRDKTTRDAQVTLHKKQDQLIIKSGTAGDFADILSTCKKVIKNASTLRVPLYIFLSGQEKIVDNQQAKLFYKSLPQDLPKSITLFNDMRHSLLNDIGREYVFKTIYKIFEQYVHPQETAVAYTPLNFNYEDGIITCPIPAWRMNETDIM